MKSTCVTKGSGYIFRNLGFSEERSAKLVRKSRLLQVIQEMVKGRDWKQVEASSRLARKFSLMSIVVYGEHTK